MTSHDPLVSVIIPTRNRSSLLALALASVLRQTYSNYEILVVDDLSDDDTASVVSAPGDPRIRYFLAPRRLGASGGRNYGLRHARGEYVAFLDSDDEWLPAKLERQVEVLRAAPPDVALVYTGMTVKTDSGEERVRRASHAGEIAQAVLKYNPIGTPSRVMIRRESLAALEGFDENLIAHEDWELYVRVTRRWQVAIVPDPMVVYREHSASTSATPFRNIEGRLQLWSKCGIDSSSRTLRSFHYARLAHDLVYRGGPADLGILFFARAFLTAPWRLDYVVAAVIAALLGARQYHRLAFAVHRLAYRCRESLPMY